MWSLGCPHYVWERKFSSLNRKKSLSLLIDYMHTWSPKAVVKTFLYISVQSTVEQWCVQHPPQWSFSLSLHHSMFPWSFLSVFLYSGSPQLYHPLMMMAMIDWEFSHCFPSGMFKSQTITSLINNGCFLTMSILLKKENSLFKALNC